MADPFGGTAIRAFSGCEPTFVFTHHGCDSAYKLDDESATTVVVNDPLSV